MPASSSGAAKQTGKFGDLHADKSKKQKKERKPANVLTRWQAARDVCRTVWVFKAEQELKAHFHAPSLYLVSKPHFLEPSRKWRSAGGERARMPATPGMWRNLPHPDGGRERSISPPGGLQQIVQRLCNTEPFWYHGPEKSRRGDFSPARGCSKELNPVL